jgi:hypothetical protein
MLSVKPSAVALVVGGIAIGTNFWRRERPVRATQARKPVSKHRRPHMVHRSTPLGRRC